MNIYMIRGLATYYMNTLRWKPQAVSTLMDDLQHLVDATDIAIKNARVLSARNRLPFSQRVIDAAADVALSVETVEYDAPDWLALK